MTNIENAVILRSKEILKSLGHLVENVNWKLSSSSIISTRYYEISCERINCALKFALFTANNGTYELTRSEKFYHIAFIDVDSRIHNVDRQQRLMFSAFSNAENPFDKKDLLKSVNVQCNLPNIICSKFKILL